MNRRSAVGWDFSTEPEFQEKLDWANAFVRNELEPLDIIFPGQEWLPLDGERRKVIPGLQDQVRKQGLWAPHLDPELGGQGFGAVKLCLINEILGRTTWASVAFGTMAPDTGNSEILARFGTEEQKATYLEPLLAGEIKSCFSVTEPQGGGDPKVFTTIAVKDGDDWMINGRKYFSSNADVAQFLIVMAITDPEQSVVRGSSLFVIPRGTPGIIFEDNHHLHATRDYEAHHGLLHYDNVRVPDSAMLGPVNAGFQVMQTRMAGGRLHMSMRAIGLCNRIIEMIGERAKSRFTQGSSLADKQFVQGFLADSYIELLQYRMMVLHASWLVDQGDTVGARREIAAVKATMPRVVRNIVERGIQIHGALGTTDKLPLMKWLGNTMVYGIADGPTDVHRANLGKALLKDFEPAADEWPTEFYDYRLARAKEKYGDLLTSIPHLPPARVPNWQAELEW